MKNNLISQIKKMIWDQTERKGVKNARTNLTFECIEYYIANAPNRKVAILSVWLLYQDEKTCRVKTWAKWQTNFFEVYKAELPVWATQVPRTFPGKRIKKADIPELMEVFGDLKRVDVFGRCTYEELACWLKELFRLQEEVETLIIMMKPEVLNYGNNDIQN